MTSIHAALKHRRAAGRGDDGLTLIELLVAMVLLAGITAGIASAFALTVKTSGTASDRIRKSNDAQAISNFLVPDAASAGAYGADNRVVSYADIAPGVVLATPSSGFCPDVGGQPIVRFEWIERTASPTISRRVAANYAQVDNTLARRGCTQPFDTTTGATAGDATISDATLARNVGAVSGQCDPGCTTAFRMPNSVTLTVTSTALNDEPLSAYTYSVTGSLRVGQLAAGDASNPSSQILSLLALGAESAPCPAPTTPRASGLAITSSADRLTVYGAAAVNATTSAGCGAALALNGQISATETLSLTGTTCQGSGCSTGNQRKMGAPIPDPYRDLAPPPNASACGTGGANPGPVATNTLGPGVYRQQLDLTQFLSTVYFRPGVYILCNGMVAGANLQLSTIAAGTEQAGSLFYIAGGTITIDSSAQVALRGMAAGPYKDLLIWQTRSTAQGGDITLTTGVDALIFFTFHASYRGVVYAPLAQVRMVDGSHLLGFRQLEATVDTIVARNVYIGGTAGWATGDTRVRMGPGPATTTLLTLSKNPFVYGESVTLTAQVSRVAPSTAADGAITGSVIFQADGEPIGTAVNVDSNGRATLTTNTLEGGTHALTAAYSGDSTYSSSISPPIGTTVERVAPTVTLTDLVEPSGVGQPASFRVVVSGPGATPTGAVTLYEGTTVVGAGTLVNGSVVISTSTLSEGTHTLRATYEGNASYFAANSNSIVHHVRRAVTVALSASPAANTTVGQPLTLTATVTRVQNLNPPPSGTVTFFDGTTEIAANVPLSGTTAAVTTSSLGLGVHQLTARYNGDAQWGVATSNQLTRTVERGAPTVAIGTPTQAGTNVTFPVTVTGAGPTPTGTVQLYRNGSTQGTTVTLVNGAATITATNLPTGSNQVFFVRYSGDANYAAADSATVTLTITRGVELTRTAPNGNGPWTTNTDFDFNADVVPAPTGSSPANRGTVRLYRTSQLGVRTQIGSTLIPATNGEVNFNDINLPPGTWTISAEWTASGSNPETASSNTLSLTIPGTTSTSLARTAGSSSNPYGDLLRYIATVSPNPGSGNGTVQLYVDGDEFGPPVAINSSGQATFTPVLSVGSHTVYARYSGDVGTGYDASQSSPPLNQSIVRDTPNVSVSRTSGSDPALVGASLTFSATVPANGGGATPTGMLQWQVDGVSVGAPVPVGTSFTTSSLARGDRAIRAIYSGDTNYTGSTSNSVNQTIGYDVNSVSLSKSPNGSGPFLTTTSFTFSVSVNRSNGLPSLNGMAVQLLDGGTVIATANLAGSGTTATATFPPVSGVSSGNKSFTARLVENPTYNQATSSPTSFRVSAFTMSTYSVSSSTNSNNSTTLTITGPSAYPATGNTVTFSRGSDCPASILGPTVGAVTRNGSGQLQVTITYRTSSNPGTANATTECFRNVTVNGTTEADFLDIQ